MLRTPIAVLAIALAPAAALAQVDVDNLRNYANQAVPNYITLDDTPADNPITDIGATLGRVLFYDKNLSINNSTSCSSCHQQSAAFSDTNDASVGHDGGTTSRHSMRLVNNRFRRTEDTAMFWDKRAADQEDQMTQPIKDHIEMGFSGQDGNPDFDDLIDKIKELPYYRGLFKQTYGNQEITEEKIQKALAQFVRSIQSFDSKYDAGRQQVNNFIQPFPNFTDDENAGKLLFLENDSNGGANCQVCHSMDNFELDATSTPGGNSGGNNGVITSLDGGTDTTNTRSPNLRDVVDANGVPHGGFMHDASMSTLTEVVEHYNDLAPVDGLDARLGGGGQPGVQPTGQQLNLDDTQIAQIVAFLETLTGSDVYTNEKWADPFAIDGALQVLGIEGDFNTDGAPLIEDLDLLALALITESQDPLFDLDDSGEVDRLDLDQWLLDAALFNDLDSAYLLGDANLDGAVDGDDYLIWRDNYGGLALWSTGDFNVDGSIDAADYALWRANLGGSSLLGAAAADASPSQAVPEPSAIVVLLVLLAVVSVIQRRSRLGERRIRRRLAALS